MLGELFRRELAGLHVALVEFRILLPLLGKVVQRKDRRDWADWYAGAAVDAFDRVNEELVDLFEPRATILVLCILLRMDAVHWADIDRPYL